MSEDYKQKYFDEKFGNIELSIKSLSKELKDNTDETRKINSRVQTLEDWKKSSRSPSFVWYKDKRITTMLAVMGVLFMLIMLKVAEVELPKWLI